MAQLELEPFSKQIPFHDTELFLDGARQYLRVDLNSRLSSKWGESIWKSPTL
jgi:hypothetical protein